MDAKAALIARLEKRHAALGRFLETLHGLVENATDPRVAAGHLVTLRECETKQANVARALANLAG